MYRYLQILRRQRRPARFLASRVLTRSGLSSRYWLEWHGFRLRFHPSNLAAQIWVNNGARWEDSAFLRRWLRPGDVYVDVGANIGTTVLPAARIVGEDGQVVAIEAHPRTFGYLCENVAANGLINVEALWSAVGAAAGAAQFGDLTSDDRNGVVPGGGIYVRQRTLDTLLADLPRISLMKVDVEGYEKFVFEGATAAIQRTDCVVFESFDVHAQQWGYSVSDVVERLQRAGMVVFKWDGLDVLVPLGTQHRSPKVEDLVAIRKGVPVRGPFKIQGDRE